MASASIVITGANSYLGGGLVRHLISRTPWHVHVIVSHKGSASPVGLSHSRLTISQTDLTQVLPSEVEAALSQATCIFHFAWARASQLDRACALNRRMIEGLLNSTPTPSSFRFISSVSASPSARSVYARAKHAIARAVVEQGGIAVACGLVMGQPPSGPYALLSRAVELLPLRMRFSGDGPLVYPIEIGNLCERLTQSVEMDLPAGNYKLWDAPVRLNTLLARMERDTPRLRMAFPLSTQAVTFTALGMVRLGLPGAGLADKVVTFLNKDEAYLSALPDLRREAPLPSSTDGSGEA